MSGRQVNDNPDVVSSQDEWLVDVRKSGKSNDWDGKKAKNVVLSDMMDDMEYFGSRENLKMRVRSCGDLLWFIEQQDGTKKLHSARLCRYRLCPICVWRRSLKTFANTARILDYITKDKQYKYIFLTLTVRNVEQDELCSAMDELLAGWKRLHDMKRWKQTVKGFYRGIEVTRNHNPKSPSYGTYHPHIHAILVVNNSYGHNGDYIGQKEWQEMWKACCRMEYDPIIDIRSIRPLKDETIIGAVCEASKYPIKDNDYIVPDDLEFSQDTIKALDESLRGRRLAHYGGVMRDAQKALNIKDVDTDDDLVTITDEDKEAAENAVQTCYAFNLGYMRYRRVDAGKV